MESVAEVRGGLQSLGQQEECLICCTSRDQLLKLAPCGHRLCEKCVDRLDNAVLVSQKDRRCPFCRQEFEVVASPLGLARICLGRLQYAPIEYKQLRRFPPELKGHIFRRIANGRLLYGQLLVELLRGTSLDTIKLSDTVNLRSLDLQIVAPLLGAPPRRLILERIELLDDLGLRAMLAVCGSALCQLDVCKPAEHLDGSSLKVFADKMPKLEELSLYECRGLQTEYVMDVLAGVSANLKTLDLSCCYRLETEAIRSIAACTALRRLSLFGLWKIDTESVVEVMRSCTKLRYLDVTRCAKLRGPDILAAAAGHLPDLQKLLVGSLMDIGDEEVLSLVMSTVGSGLQYLNISDSAVTRESMQAIQRHCPCLNHLDISWCHNVAENPMIDMITFMPQLKVLNCRGCRGISNKAMFFVAQLVSNRALGFDETPQLKQQRPGVRSHVFPTDSDSCCATAASPGSSGSSSSSAGTSSARLRMDSDGASASSSGSSGPALAQIPETGTAADAPDAVAVSGACSAADAAAVPATGQPMSAAPSAPNPVAPLQDGSQGSTPSAPAGPASPALGSLRPMSNGGGLAPPPLQRARTTVNATMSATFSGSMRAPDPVSPSRAGQRGTRQQPFSTSLPRTQPPAGNTGLQEAAEAVAGGPAQPAGSPPVSPTASGSVALATRGLRRRASAAELAVAAPARPSRQPLSPPAASSASVAASRSSMRGGRAAAAASRQRR